MSARSDIMRGNNIFIKVISLTEERGVRLVQSVSNNGVDQPFSTNEFLANYFIGLTDQNANPNFTGAPVINSILTPGTMVLVYPSETTVENFQIYKESPYEDTIQSLRQAGFIDVNDYFANYISEGYIVRTAIIVSRTMTGSYNEFLHKYKNDPDADKLLLDSLIHICYLYHVFQQKYNLVHGDPKIQNYTWLELDQPIDIEYDFRCEYNNGEKMIIRRSGVKHLFYLTDLEFVYSPILKVFQVGNQQSVLNFSDTDLDMYQQDTTPPKRLIPVINKETGSYGGDLYGGYKDTQFIPNQPPNSSLYDYFGDSFPRMYTIDILVLIKMLLTYGTFTDTFSGDVLRKLNMYFTMFISYSRMEDDIYRGQHDYTKLSPGGVAELLNA